MKRSVPIYFSATAAAMAILFLHKEREKKIITIDVGASNHSSIVLSNTTVCLYSDSVLPFVDFVSSA